MDEYRIDYTVHRRRDGEEDFTEIGFGTSGDWFTPAGAAHMVESAVQRYDWESEPGMPEPEDVKREIEEES